MEYTYIHYFTPGATETDGNNFFGKCPYCGYYHDLDKICPYIEEIEYYPNGQVKRVKMRKSKGVEDV